MRRQIERGERLFGVSAEDFGGRFSRIERYQQGDEPLDDMGVGIPAQRQDAVLARDVEPDLAGAALHLVGVVALFLRIRIERTAEVDQIFVSIVPVVEKGEIGENVVKARHAGEIGEGARARKPGFV